jgi:signal transduction histidine kinase
MGRGNGQSGSGDGVPMRRRATAAVHPTAPARLAATAARAVLAGTALLTTLSSPALAAAPIGPLEVTFVSAVIGSLVFAAVVTVALVRTRAAAAERIRRAEAAARDAGRRAERAEALLEAEEERLVVLSAGEPTRSAGRLPPESGVPADTAALTAFDDWLHPESAAALTQHLDRLAATGERFRLTLTTTAGAPLEASGRATGAKRVLRLRDLGDERRRVAAAEAALARVESESAALKALIARLPHPLWLRDPAGRLVWFNDAYARAVEAPDGVPSGEGTDPELLDSADRAALQQALEANAVVGRRVAVVAAGERRILDVVAAASEQGSGGIGVDVTELDVADAALKRTLDYHTRTLDQLATAVAIFGPDRRLTFYNAAYQSLWGLDIALLEGRPEDGALLDALRSARKLPEQADFRAWKTEVLSTYRSVEAHEHWWHLPDGQTLRVLASPHPQGGVTYVYENVTERLDLESRYNALIRVQGETLDHLAEGVAVFGSDGRLRLWNPAFASLWDVDLATLTERPHIGAFARRAAAPGATARRAWEEIAAAVTGLAEGRPRAVGRCERGGEAVLDYATVPLPDGATLATFVDVTDSVKVERALIDRNEALIAADRIKDAFIQHVSYELRSPLTTVIGFAQLLADARTGPLTDKQREYTDYILSSAGALLAIINDILDLATIDAGAMGLELSDVDVAGTIAAAVEGVQDRLRESRLELSTKVPDDVGSFVGDEKRIRQVLFNLLSNAIAHSDPGGRIEIACAREAEGVRIAVSDRGRGIPPELIDQVFDRFVARPTGASRHGAGLGLSIVKSFVALHGGTVAIDSKEGAGTTVICRFPTRPRETAAALPAPRWAVAP